MGQSGDPLIVEPSGASSVAERTVVVGGGVAGIAAALRLAEAGVAVELLEMRRQLGGRATSATDPRTQVSLDNCQHVVLRCCPSLLKLYEMLGVGDSIRWHRRFNFLHADGTLDALDRGLLPAPLHLAGSFWRMRGLTMADKLAIGRAMFWIRRQSPASLARWHDRSFAEWLTAQRQPAGAVERFWEVTVVSACNESLDRVAADYGLQVFSQGLLASRRGYEMGLSSVPLRDLYDAAVPRIEQSGGLVRLGAAVRRLGYETDTQRVTGVELANGEWVPADTVISALPFDALGRVVADQPAMIAADRRLQCLGEWEVSPILGLHLWVKASDGRPPLKLPHVVFTGAPLHWLFVHGPLQDGVQHLHGVISAAGPLVEQSSETLLDMAMEQLRRAMRAAEPGRQAVLTRVDGRVFKERRATFSLRPGSDALRPGTRGAVNNLLLAGDWCATGWPATMEGAAQSGFAAAAAKLFRLTLDPK